MSTKTTRGGKREGAGRPPLDPEEKRIRVSFRLDPETVRILADLAKKRGTTKTNVISQLIKNQGGETK